MFRGSYRVKTDESGRVKIPEDFLKILKEQYESNEVFVTSLSGRCVRVYPMKVWTELENKILSLPSMVPALEKFLTFTSYYGKVSRVDSKGRLLIHPKLREDAVINGEVVVMGRLRYMEIWNREMLEDELGRNRFTEKDAEELAKWGI